MKTTITNLLIVGAGSCAGGMTRYLVSRVMQSICNAPFPWGTFIVNITGCFIIGLVYGLIDRGFHLTEGMKLFITVGFCGGFTTFSTFMHENYLLSITSQHVTILLYFFASVLVGFMMVCFAYALTRI